MKTSIALVTGANKGIGYATVKSLLQNGHTVIMTSRNEELGKKAFDELSPLGKLYYHQLDISQQDSIVKAFDFITKTFGRLDILINNAGINYDTWQNAINADIDQVRDTLDTNLFGTWKLTQVAIPLMIQNNYGRIVNVSSDSASILRMGAGAPGYSISKAALNILTIKMSRNLQNYDILIN
ncbi:SDR family NAD(P)-dependent oxidoreductase [Halosquirtibacter xylanolyticus]|uniref:SDR family NAD(P)-dependent oxidoreductase n=1 Tax=Halosquirtibacter xylanolyticus TaxID=3374599 RepID=UPI003747F867|nr:SDR family NAD(P)-dependent oxidoreductase [Prolixibacteraceae bacterium]